MGLLTAVAFVQGIVRVVDWAERPIVAHEPARGKARSRLEATAPVFGCLCPDAVCQVGANGSSESPALYFSAPHTLPPHLGPPTEGLAEKYVHVDAKILTVDREQPREVDLAQARKGCLQHRSRHNDYCHVVERAVPQTYRAVPHRLEHALARGLGAGGPGARERSDFFI